MARPFYLCFLFCAAAAVAIAGCGGGSMIGGAGGRGSGESSASRGKPPASVTSNAAPKCASGGDVSDQPPLCTTSEQTFGLACSPPFVMSAGGYSSCNVQWLEHINLKGGETIGAHYIAAKHTYYITNFETGLYAFDTTNPEAPVLASNLDVGLKPVPAGALISTVENEDTGTDGTLAIVSRTPSQDVVVIDASNPHKMSILSTLSGADGHTQHCMTFGSNTCAFDYTAYQPGGTGGHVVDLRDPAKPVLDADWSPLINNAYAHNLTEIRPGLAAAASDPVDFLDTTDPLKPSLLFSLPQTPVEPKPAGVGPAQSGHIGHSVRWPRLGRDKFFFGQSEGIYMGLCAKYPHDGRTLYGYDTTGWRTTHKFNLVGAYTLISGNDDEGKKGGIEEVDSNGSPSTVVVGAPEGCSSHWFDVNQRFNDGGLIAMSSFAFGVRLLNVASNGQIQQVGWFVPSGAADTVGVHWITDRVMYLIDFEQGGLDVIKYTGPLPESGPLAISSLPSAPR